MAKENVQISMNEQICSRFHFCKGLLEVFKDFHFNSPHPQISETDDSSCLRKDYTDEDLSYMCLFVSSCYKLLKSLQ